MLSELFLWLVVFSCVFLFAFWIERFRINYFSSPFTVSSYFLACSLGAYFLFRDYFREIKNIDKNAFFILIGLIFYSIVILAFFSRQKKPKELFFRFGKNQYLRLDYRYYISKFFEVIFQQVMIIILVSILQNESFLIRSLSYIFLFGLIHLFLIRRDGLLFSLIFTIFGIISAFIFPYLILNVKNGIAISFALHYGFYLVLVPLFWIIYIKK